ncbi:MAG TPA: APC family permease [Clostridiales bacterium]|nr:APC family permease [Clostridiales bacterium]
MNIKGILLGKPLKNNEINHEKLSKGWGLPIMASDAVSSVAYAGEEILLVLVPILGLASFKVVPWVTLPIILLLLILIVSYSQVIDLYPQGGGAYNVTKENLGKNPSLVAAASLVVDYIMTVAVSVSSAAAAITSAFPSLFDFKVLIALIFLALITLGNLRGVRESSNLFGMPTYIFIFSMGIMIVVGLVRLLTNSMEPLTYTADNPHLVSENFGTSMAALSIILVLHAFSSGCTALTGVEAVSDATDQFKTPAQHNAKVVLYMLGGVCFFIFGGVMLLEVSLKVLPLDNVTVVSQIASVVFGNTYFAFMYYIVQIFTAFILVLAANTAFNGLPALMYILAGDGFVPRQFATRGTKLSFSNGIVFIFIVAGLLILEFKANVHHMIPLYTIGVFISFTLCQYGMVRCWLRLQAKGWRHKLAINGFGALMTFVGTCVVIYNKFLEGAWMVIIAIPMIMAFMIYVNKHYSYVGEQLKLQQFHPYYENMPAGSCQCIVLVQTINKSLLKSLNYAKTISDNVTALNICRSPEQGEALRRQWENMHIPVPLKIVETPYQDIIKPLDDYIWDRENRLQHGEFISVIIIKFLSDHWYDSFLHNQTTYFIEHTLSKHKNVSTTILPFHYHPEIAKFDKGQEQTVVTLTDLVERDSRKINH